METTLLPGPDMFLVDVFGPLVQDLLPALILFLSRLFV
jgi:hypothetical protein